ncbi:putative reverse transcriptase domain-containing protein [Tanacetum coccineum]
MSDSKDSTVNYTAVSSPFEDGSDIGSLGVDGPPIMPKDPYAYIMAAYQVPPSPDYIPGSLEACATEDEILPAEEQPLPTAASPTADSPGYVLESDLEEEPEEDDEDPEEDPADYPADRDDDDDEEEEEEEPFGDDADDEDEDEDEEEEHPAPADSVPPVHRMTARISIRDEPSISLPPREEVERLLALTTPPPSPLTPLSSPLPHIPSPPFPASPPASVLPASPPLYEIGESSAVATTRPVGGRRADYGFVSTMDTEIRRRRAEEEQDTQDIYAVLEDTQDRQTQIYQSVETLFGMWGGRGSEHEVKLGMTRLEIKGIHPEMLQADYQRQVQLAKALKLLKGLQTQMHVMHQDGDDSHTSGGNGVPEGLVASCRGMLLPIACQVKFAMCTVQGNALTWWNSHVKTTTPEAAHNLKVKDTDVVTYSQHFQELALMCDWMFSKEIDKVEKYKINTWAERQADNKRKSDDTARNNQNQQPNKRQNTRRAYAAGNGDKRPYEGPRPLCSKCNYHHDGPCAPKCHKCNRFGHLSRDCRNPPNVNTGANQRVCFECGAQGHFKRDCPKLKNNNNRGNRVGNAKAQAKVYAVGNAGANPDNNVVTGTFLLNNRYASILFDTGADRSFVSTAFSSRIVITPTALDHDYNVELADGRIVGLNTIIRGCTLNFLNHPFNIDLMPVELGSFDVIIGMDWLAKYHAVIVCAEKIVRIPFGDEILIVRGDGSSNEHGTRLNIISCTKAQEYLTKGCHVFLANITATKDKDKSKGKRLEDVPVVQEFPEVIVSLRTCRISTVRNEGASGATTGTYGQRLHKTKFLTPWGAPVLFVKKNRGLSGSACDYRD